MKTAGIILAGGLSSRFGSPKAFAKWEGIDFYELSLRALSPHCEHIVIVTRPELVDQFPNGLHVVTDLTEFAGHGPIAGVLSGMEAVEADRYIVLPCDMPLMNPDVIGRLVEFHKTGVTGVVSDGKNHPLVSVWDGKSKPVLRNALDIGLRRVMNVQEIIGVRWVDGVVLSDDASKVFMNVNTPDILKGVDEDGSDCR